MGALLILLLSLLPTMLPVHAAENWVWQNPLPQGNAFNDVFALDSLTAYAVGNSGTVCRTSDGINWQAQKVGTATHLRAVHFFDASTGIAGGDSGIVLVTTNGGADWVRRSSGQKTSIYDFQFLNSKVGFAAALVGVLGTSDGGTTWRKLLSAVPVKALHFANEKVGYAVSNSNPGRIWKTSDGGESWAPQTLPPVGGLLSVTFSSPDTGWAAGERGTLIKTVNGGAEWTLVFMSDSYTINSIRLLDPQTGFVAMHALGKEVIWGTTDGGNSWEEKFTSETYKSLNAVYFANRQVGFAVGQAGWILRTVDGGGSWKPQAKGVTDMINSIHFVNEKVGYAVGGGNDNGTLLKTTNGGAAWVEIRGKLDKMFYSVFFTDERTGYAAGRDRMLLKTGDGGETWKISLPASAYRTLMSVHFPTPDVGYCVGDSGSVHRTSDAGMSWQPQKTGTSVYLNCVRFWDANVGYAVGANGVILKTADGGTNWRVTVVDTSRKWIQSVAPAGLKTAYAVGDNGLIFKTGDAGETWNLQASGTTHQLRSVTFLNETIGYVVGGYGTLLKTVDGGLHWVHQDLGSDNYFRSVQFLSEKIGFAAGSDGTLLKYDANLAVVKRPRSMRDARPMINGGGLEYFVDERTHVRVMFVDALGRVGLKPVDARQPAGWYTLKMPNHGNRRGF